MSVSVYRPYDCNWRGNICIISYTVAMGVYELVTAVTRGCLQLSPDEVWLEGSELKTASRRALRHSLHISNMMTDKPQ